MPFAEEGTIMTVRSFYASGFQKQPMHKIRLLPFIIVAILLCGMVNVVFAAPTTAIHVVKYAADGTTVLNETTVTYQWMEAHLPVQGDGKTHYYHQGPVFTDEKEDQWDRNETTNFKDMGAVKGTAVRDLGDLVGGMVQDDEVMVKSGDGYHVEFPYANIYSPNPRQGTITVCWLMVKNRLSVNGREPVILRIITSGCGWSSLPTTPPTVDGKHVFGNQDMREVMPEETIHLFDNLYPSTSGYTVKWVDEIRIYSGGYNGSADLLPKSYQSKMDETYPAPPSAHQPQRRTCLYFFRFLRS